jgi:hypothetical protein
VLKLKTNAWRVTCEITPELAQADYLLSEYGRWARTWGRGGVDRTAERQYRREFDGRDRLEEFEARRVPANPLMLTADAMICQRALQHVGYNERCLLIWIYIWPQYLEAKLRQRRIPPDLCRIRHAGGLIQFKAHHQRLRRSRY